jgi:ankyrin repeat protein
LENVKLLIAAGAEVTRPTLKGITALHSAAEQGHAAVVKLLLQHGAGAVLNTMQCEMCTCCSPVSALMMCENAAVLKLLLAVGGDVSAVTGSGDTCLHVAERHSHPVPSLCVLIKAGVKLHAVNAMGDTAADVAEYYGHKLIEQLLNRAAQQA